MDAGPELSRVRLLGPVDVTVGGEVRALPGLRRKALLAVLGLHRGAVVALDRIAGLVWADEAGAVLPNTVQRHVSGLRAVLGDRAAVEARPPGYVLHAGTDLALAEARIRAGRAEERAEAAAGHLRAALALWRGPSLAGLGELGWLRGQGRRLDELRREVRLDLIDARLRLGPHGALDALTAELEALAARHPLDERIQGQLMTALAGAGRPGAALAVFARLEEALDRELGLRPGAGIRARAEALRRPGPARAPAPDRPAQLPAAVPGFAGRAAELDRLDALAVRGPGAAGFVTVSGTAGVGKTALALYWAHRAAARFPDGQVYVNLLGFDPAGAAVHPAAALAAVLEALGVPAHEIPDELPGRAERYRALLAARRLLVVLDNARDEEQVRPLLAGPAAAEPLAGPGGVRGAGQVAAPDGAGGSLVLVTSRGRLPGPAVALGLMSPDEAHDLLRRRLGGTRLAAEPDAVAEIAARCARLPLAMSVVAAQASARPGAGLAELAGELRDAARRWQLLDAGDAVSDVRAVLSWSYLALGPAAARMFRLIGVHPGPQFGLPAAAALAGVEPAVAADLLGELVRASLLDAVEPGRFAMHDLLRGYARELADREGDDGGGARVLEYYRRHTIAAAVAISPSWPPPEEVEPGPGQAWLDTERPNLLGAVAAAAAAGLDTHAWQLAWALTDLLERQGRWDDWQAAHTTGLAAAERLGDEQAVAHLHRGLGRLRMWQRRYPESRASFAQALRRFRRLGDRHGEARTEHNLCQLADREGRGADAVRHAQRSLDLCRAAGDTLSVAKELNALAWCHAELGDLERARAAAQEAAAVYRGFDDPAQEGPVQHTLGAIHRRLGEHRAAAECYERARELSGRAGDRFAEAMALDGLGDARLALGEPAAARALWERALLIFTELGHGPGEAVRAKLARPGRD